MNTFLFLHIITGTIGLVCGLLIIFLRKADQKHQLLGKIYFYSLGFSMLFSFAFSVPKQDIFLFCIGVWTLYMIITGNRALKLKNNDSVSIYDYSFTGIMTIFGVLLIGYGIFQVVSHQAMSIVSFAFGLLSLLFVYNDIRLFRGRSRFKNPHHLAHIQKMMGSFISALTAFIVVNNTVLPGLIAWLLPTIVLTPLIVMWSRKWGIMKQ